MVENSRQALSTQRLTYTVISREGGGVLLLIDVNTWINNKCSVCVISHLNTSDWLTYSHS